MMWIITLICALISLIVLVMGIHEYKRGDEEGSKTILIGALLLAFNFILTAIEVTK